MGKFCRMAAGLALMLYASSSAMAQTQVPADGPDRPNFLVIVTDDLGFSDLGAFGGEIHTPNLDRLARSGVRLARFHTASACAPTRAMLLTGSDSHRVGLGNMGGMQEPNQIGRAGYEGYLRADAPTVAERLSAAGYRTLYSGKWHVGMAPDQDPHARGFQQSFSFPGGAHNHFGKDLDSTARGGSLYRENGVTVANLPADFYSSDYFATKLIDQLRSGRQGEAGKKPFFAYLSFTAPHSPLQAPAATIAKYRGRYDKGFEALRSERLQRQQALGLLARNATVHPLTNTPRWAALPADEQRRQARFMEVYAAMVDRLDENVGRVIAALEETGEFENTVVVFLSDNGAEGQWPKDAKYAFVTANLAKADNSHESLGSARSWIYYGPGWAQAATAPSWGFKTFSTEGGTRSVAFVAGPVVKRPGTISQDFAHVTDVVPTILDLAGVPVEPGTFANRAAQPIDGLSWRPLLDKGAAVYPDSKPVGSELFGSRALHQGDWKITDTGDGKWRLFNIASDPGETRDLSADEPARKAALIKAWDAYAADVGVVPADPPSHPSVPLQER